MLGTVIPLSWCAKSALVMMNAFLAGEAPSNSPASAPRGEFLGSLLDLAPRGLTLFESCSRLVGTCGIAWLTLPR